jgi:RNA polymerase sigma-70 factor (ECF subfamily)
VEDPRGFLYDEHAVLNRADRLNLGFLMDRTRSTLLMRVCDPADAEAWREFLALYEPLLTAYLRRRGLGLEATRDVVQDILARLVKALPDFKLERRRGRFGLWLLQLCRSELVEWARRRRQARSEDDWLRRLSEWPCERPKDNDSTWRKMHRCRVLAFALERVRARTQPTIWACFERHLLQGRSRVEVARELDLSVNDVGINCTRILDRVRTFCAEYLEEVADGLELLPGGP